MPRKRSALDIAAILAPVAPGVAAVVLWRAGQAGWTIAAVCVGFGTLGAMLVLRRVRAAHAGEAAARESHAQAEAKALAVESERFNMRAAFDGAAGSMLLTDGSGAVLLCNADAERFLGRGRETILGRHMEELFTHAEVLSRHRLAMEGRTGESRVRMSPRGAAEPRTYEVRAGPVTLVGGERGSLTTLRDVTDLALAVQLKTDFVANASHELRTPLASIKAAIETLGDGAWEDAVMRDRLTKMTQNNVARLEELIADLLDLSRLESAQAPPAAVEIDAPALCERLRESFERMLADRGLTLSIELDPRLRRLTTDPKLLDLILRNLIDNALKFAYEKTTIRLLGEVRADERVNFRVIDRGIGIPLGQQRRVFERFYQVDPSRTTTTSRPRGTGLGLAIVKHAVNALGGAVEIRSVWKEGTEIGVLGVGRIGPPGADPGDA